MFNTIYSIKGPEAPFGLKGEKETKMKSISPFLKTHAVNLVMAILVLLALTIIFVDQASSREVDEKEYYVLPIEGLNLRSYPSASSKLVSAFPYGTKLKASIRTSDWVFVTYSEKEGWVKAEYLTEKPPVELSARTLQGKDLVSYNIETEHLLAPAYQDYNNDGRDDVLFTVQKAGLSTAKRFYIYGYKDGYQLTKYAEISPEKTPGYYVNGYRGGESLIVNGDKATLIYPVYNENDGICCPTGGQNSIELEI